MTEQQSDARGYIAKAPGLCECELTAYQDVCIHGVHMRSDCEDCAHES